MRGEIDVRRAGVRDLLPHDGRGEDEVLHQAQRGALQGAEGRQRLRGASPELLRRVHDDGLRSLSQHVGGTGAP
jgi:hypothetical protein